jgi:hypothetical protein
VITSPTACARSSSATISAEVRTTLRRANGTPRAWGPSAHLAGNSPLTSAKIRGASFIAIASWRALYGATGLPRICLTTRLLFRAKQNRGRSDRAQKIVRWNNCVLSLEWQSHSGQCAQRLQGLWDLLKRPPRPFQSILSILTLSETCLIQRETPSARSPLSGRANEFAVPFFSFPSFRRMNSGIRGHSWSGTPNGAGSSLSNEWSQRSTVVVHRRMWTPSGE